MGLFENTIRKRDEIDKARERVADLNMINNIEISGTDTVSMAQNVVRYILGRYHIKMDKVYGCDNVDDMLDLVLDPLGMMYDEVDTKDTRWKKRTDLMLGFLSDGKAVVLIPGLFGYMWMYPGDGKRHPVNGEVQLEQKAYAIYRPLPHEELSFYHLVVYMFYMLSPKDYVMVTAASFAVTMLGLVVPKMNEFVLEQIVPKGQDGIPMLMQCAILFVVAGIIRSSISAIRGVYLGRTRERIACKTQAAVMARLLLLPQRYCIKYTTGALAKQISNARRLCDQIIGFILDSSLTALFSVAYIFQMGRFTKVMVWPALVVLFVRIVLSVIIAFSEAANSRDSLEAETESESFLYTAIRGVQTIKSSGAERRLYVNWAKRYSKVLKYDLDKPTLLKLEDVLISLVSSMGTVILISLVIPYKIAVTDYMAFVNSYGLVVTACSGLMDSFSKLVLMRPMAETLSGLMKESIECAEAKTYLRSIRGEIKVENVSFSYEGSNRTCLKDISINIEAGEKVALVGESGSGKSTILKLIMGSLRPDSGGIYIDGNELDNINLRSYRKHVGSVFQFSNLMPGTVYSNIASCPVPVSRQDAQEAIKKAAIDDYIDTLPMGQDTEISDSGFRGFSGGQRQRILLARAFASHPKILLLDEATSALDNVTQARVLESVYRESCTVVIVAHRLSTVKDCDRIIMIDDGRIIEEGPYKQLMEKNGAFAELVRKQQETPLEA